MADGRSLIRTKENSTYAPDRAQPQFWPIGAETQGSRIRDQRLSMTQGPATSELHRRWGKRPLPNQDAWLSGGFCDQIGLMREPW